MGESIVLSIQPDNVRIQKTVNWRTDVQQMDSGHEQRRTVWSIPLVDLTFDFKQAFENGELDDLLAFYDARKGAFESFTVPSWAYDAQLTADYSPPGTTLEVTNTARFTTSATSIGNLIVVGRRTSVSSWVMESVRVAGLTATSITLASALNTFYNTNDFVYVGYLVRFSSDSLNREIIAGKAHISSEVTFKGVRS
ncbi:MAG: DUF2460 domain-containing protein [Mariprofundaceae bacterium]|nr:DUF2460 domain-containing protein [Mariprofundaceae bacterium]